MKKAWIVRFTNLTPDDGRHLHFYLSVNDGRDEYGFQWDATRFHSRKAARDAMVRCGPHMWDEIGRWPEVVRLRQAVTR